MLRVIILSQLSLVLLTLTSYAMHQITLPTTGTPSGQNYGSIVPHGVVTLKQLSAALENLDATKPRETADQVAMRGKHITEVQELLNAADQKTLALIKEAYGECLRSLGYQIQGKKLVYPREAHQQRYPVLFDAFLKSALPERQEKSLTIAYTDALFNHLKQKVPHFFKGTIGLYDLGSGEGVFSSDFLKVIAKQLKNGVNDISYQGIDKVENHAWMTNKELEKIGVAGQVTHADFRKYAIPQELKGTSHIVLISHSAYIIPNINEFNAKLFDLMKNDALAIYVHASENAIDRLRSTTIAHLVKKNNSEDINAKIKKSLDEASMHYFSFNFHPAIQFPSASPAVWQQLQQVQQSAYDADYSDKSTSFITLKNLLEFFAGSSLESYNFEDRKCLLNEFRKLLETNNNSISFNDTFIVAVSPHASEEFLQAVKQSMKLIETAIG